MSDLVQLRRSPADSAAPKSTPASTAATRKVYVETYGCQMNVADTEMVLGLLRAWRVRAHRRSDARRPHPDQHLRRAREGRGAGVRARQHARPRQARPDVVLGITGCMAEHLKDAIRERAPYVDLVIGPDGYRRLARSRRGGARRPRRDRHAARSRRDLRGAGSASRRRADGVIGRVTIQRGCDKFCTFCVVPYTRGRERGAPPREILRQARALVAAGCKEVQLLGQTVNSYRYEDVGFARAPARGRRRRRDRARPLHLALPARLLRRRHRRDGRDAQDLQARPPAAAERRRTRVLGAHAARLRLRDLPRARTPSCARRCPASPSRTDLLVGFCDETEEEHAATLRAQEELRFDGAFTFAYSEREGTTAARKMPDTVPAEVKSRRLAEVIALQQRITGEIMAAQVGRRERILIEHPSKRVGRRADGAHRRLPPGDRPGRARARARATLVDVTITRATHKTLFGALESPMPAPRLICRRIRSRCCR